jgi:outer membrane immunogenic protein
VRKTFLAISAIAALTGTPALAADMAVKVPVAPAPIASWTGFYVGLNGGYSLARDPFNQSITQGTLAESSSIDSRVAPQGALFGGQAGYNYQTGHFVFGVEGDFQWSGERDTAGCGLECFSGGGVSATLGSVEQKIKWFGTARGRVSYASDGWLLYLTGGGAWGGIDTTQSISESGGGLSIAASNTTSTTKGGWVFGGGTEVRITGPWSVKLEYLYMDLGNITTAALVLPDLGGPVATLATNSAIHDHIVRAGVNLKLN